MAEFDTLPDTTVTIVIDNYFILIIIYKILLIENVGRLKKLEYLNLALNNVTKIENLHSKLVLIKTGNLIHLFYF